MSDSRTILLAGGGTGGHLYPGLSVAQALVASDASVKPLFLCTQRPLDRSILEPTGFEFICQSIVPPRRTVGGLLKFFRSWRQTTDQVRHALDERKPAAVLGLGGYAAGVAVKLASKAGIPAAIVNPDVIPGKANQYLFSYVQKVCCQFEETRDRMPTAYRDKFELTGCPIRDELAHPPTRADAAARLGLDPLLHTLVVTGASQGAVTVNDAVLESLGRLTSERGRPAMQGWQVLHLAGKDNAEAVRREYRERELKALVIDFTPAMQDVWAVADLTVARSGASTLAELTACGVPSILMPYPFHKDMHQRANAEVLERAGAAVIVDDTKERKSNADRLGRVLEPLLYDVPKRKAMGDAARRLGRPDAAENVAQVLRGLIGTSASPNPA